MADAEPAGTAARPSTSWRACAATCTTSPGATTTCSPSTRRTPSPSSGTAPDAAHWMREYYRHARAIYRAAIRALEASEGQSSSLFAQFRDWRSRLSNADFSVHRERVHFRTPQHLDVEPELVLRLFEFVARHGIRLSSEAEQRIESRLPRLRDYFAERAARVAGAQPDSLAAACAAGRPARHARDRRAHRDLSRTGADRVPGDPRLLPPLHRGRAHPGRHAESVGAAHAAPTLVPQLRRPAGRGQGARACWCSPCCSTTPARALPARATWTHRCGWRKTPWRASGCRRQDREMVLFLIRTAPGPVRRDAVARRLRPADHSRRGPPGGNRGAAEGAHAADLRRHQRGESHRHDAVARRAALAALPDGLQRADARAGDRAHREPCLPGRPERVEFLQGFPDALPAHAFRGRDRRAHGARGEEPQARRGGGNPQAGVGVAADAGGARPARPVRVGGGHALQLRHEHPEGRGVRQPARPGARHLHLRRPRAHAGAESSRSGPPARHRRAGDPGQDGRAELLRNRPKPALPSRKARIPARVSRSIPRPATPPP